jgi:hypothetical protein
VELISFFPLQEPDAELGPGWEKRFHKSSKNENNTWCTYVHPGKKMYYVPYRLGRVVDPDLHYFGKPDPDPYGIRVKI